MSIYQTPFGGWFNTVTNKMYSSWSSANEDSKVSSSQKTIDGITYDISYDANGDIVSGIEHGYKPGKSRWEMRPDGSVFYWSPQANETLSSIGDASEVVVPLAIQLAAASLGGPAAVSVLQTMQGADVEDIAKTAALSYFGKQIATPISGGISEAAGGGTLGNVIGQSVTNAGMAALTGGDVEKAAVLGAIGGATKPVDIGINNPSTLTPAQIESGLGTPGYGYGAQAEESGLFNPAVIGSGAYTQTSYPIDFAELAAADAAQLLNQTNNVAAADQNLVASGLDPLIAADITQQLSLDPNLTIQDVANNLIKTYGSKLYDIDIDAINADVTPSDYQDKANQPAGKIPLGKLLEIGLGLAATGAAINSAKQDEPTGFPILPVPADWKSPEYNMAFTPSAPINFGSPELLKGTQWENPMTLSSLVNTLNTQPFVQPFQMQTIDMPDILQQFNVAPTVGTTDIIGNLNGNPVSIADIVSGIQSGQTYSI